MQPIELTLQSLCPGNTHPLPIAEAWDGSEWTVDLAVRDGRGLDIEGTASAPIQEQARAKALRRLRRSKTMYERLGYVPN